MKHLKVKATLDHHDPRRATLQIIEQTHIHYKFGGFPAGIGNKRFVWGIVAIVAEDSLYFIEKTHVQETRKAGALVTLYLGDRTGESCVFKAKYWPAIKEAIEAYNRIYSE